MSESDAEFVERMHNAASPASKKDPEWSRLFALARRGAAMQWRPTHRHVKRGSTYQVVGQAEVQAGRGVHEGDMVMVYKADDGTLWARPVSEFYDGRFVSLPPPPTGEQTDE